MTGAAWLPSPFLFGGDLLLSILFAIWEFLSQLYAIFKTVFFAIVYGIRFVFRMIAAAVLFVSNFPVSIAAVLVIGLTVGLALFVMGRN